MLDENNMKPFRVFSISFLSLISVHSLTCKQTVTTDRKKRKKKGAKKYNLLYLNTKQSEKNILYNFPFIQR